MFERPFYTIAIVQRAIKARIARKVGGFLTTIICIKEQLAVTMHNVIPMESKDLLASIFNPLGTVTK